MVWSDNDLSIPPFVPITDADLAPLVRAAVERELPNLGYGHRVAIAWLAGEYPERDAEFIHTWLLIEHNVTVNPHVIDAFLATIR
jgi:hypothetical protein